MNAELLALLEALDAVKQCTATQAKEGLRLKAIYDARLDDVLARCPNLTRDTLDAMIKLRYPRWLRAQEKPISLPPKA